MQIVIALVAFLSVTHLVSVPIASQHLTAVPITAQTPLEGKAAFNRVCAVCHGPEGRGDAAPRLTPFDRDVAEVLGIVRDGRGDMPPISDRDISDDEVRQVVAYLKSLSSTKGTR